MEGKVPMGKQCVPNNRTETTRSDIFEALQCYSYPTGYWDALGAPCIRICRLDWRNFTDHILWMHHLLYVSAKSSDY